MRWRVIGKAGLAMTLECEVFGRNAQRRGIERPMSEPGYSGGEQRDGVLGNDIKCHLLAVSSHCERLDR